MFSESERNDANPNPKHAALTAPAAKPSSASEADEDEKYQALEPQHDAKHLTPRGGFAGIQKYFGFYKPSWDYVDVLCSRYWRYKDASFVFYRGAVLSYQHMHIRFIVAASMIDPESSLPADIERLREQGFSTVLNRLDDVCDQWKILENVIQESSSKTPEDCDSFATYTEDVALLHALDELWIAERKIDSTIHPSDWKRAIVSKQKHDAKFEPFRDPERRRQMSDLYKEDLSKIFGQRKLNKTLFAALKDDLKRVREPEPFLPYCRLDDTREVRAAILGRC